MLSRIPCWCWGNERNNKQKIQNERKSVHTKAVLRTAATTVKCNASLTSVHVPVCPFVRTGPPACQPGGYPAPSPPRNNPVTSVSAAGPSIPHVKIKLFSIMITINSMTITMLKTMGGKGGGEGRGVFMLRMNIIAVAHRRVQAV